MRSGVTYRIENIADHSHWLRTRLSFQSKAASRGGIVKPSAIAALLAIALLPHQGREAVHSGALSDDGLIIAAILEATILPAHANAGTNAPLAVVSETTPLCIERSRENKCRIPEHWRTFLVPDAARTWPGLVADERIRNELVRSLETRNTESHPLPLSSYPGIVLLDLRKDPPADALDRHYRRKIGSAALSLPGYSTDGHALVYGSYSCGSLCGYGWLFVLERVGGQWQVTSATVTVIS